jgi:hypothetical protein
MGASAEIESLVREAIAGGAKNTEQIVGQVLARMQAKTGSPRELIIESRLVTLAELAGKLAGIQQLVVPAKAVITPAARDLLRQKQIDIGYSLPARTVAKSRLPLALGVAETNYDASSLVQSIAGQGVPVERLAKTGLAQVIGELCAEASLGGKLGLMLTSETAAALCLANRRAGVRAVAATNVKATLQAVRSVGANVLVIDPAGRGAIELQRIVSQFVAGAPYACPAEYATELK